MSNEVISIPSRHSMPALAMNEEERFAPVYGYEGAYEVSDHGTVVSIARVVSGGIKKQTVKPCVLAQIDNGHGYKSVRLWKNGKEKTCYVHRLVLEAFAGRAAEGCEACHNDGARSNNHISNLRWDTKANNHADKIKHGTIRNGEKARFAKLTPKYVKEIRNRIAAGEYQQSVADSFSISQTSVSDIINRRTWRHI